MKSILIKFRLLIDKTINSIIDYTLNRKEVKPIIKEIGPLSNPPGMQQWYEKWKVLGTPNKNYYRIYSKYIGTEINIVPDNLCHNVIVPLLNPKRFISTYADKNLFDKFLNRCDGEVLTPPTILRCIDGVYYDSKYMPITDCSKVESALDSYDSVIVKSSIDSSGGKGVQFFDRRNTSWVERDSKRPLSLRLLMSEMGGNFILQPIMVQSAFMAKLGHTSVNTIRMAVYRSVVDNRCHVLRSLIRIGKNGSFVDNAHAGGVFVGIDDNGKLGNYCCDQFGKKSDTFNGINFSSENLIIPSYGAIKKFAEEVGSRIPHLRLLGLDIMLDKNNKPILIEYNVKAFSPWLFQFSSGTLFREYTDEIIEYCRDHKSEATRLFISF